MCMQKEEKNEENLRRMIFKENGVTFINIALEYPLKYCCSIFANQLEIDFLRQCSTLCES